MSIIYLIHHGIKGQRWGIRRTPEQLGHYPRNIDRYDPVAQKDIKAGEIYRSAAKRFFVQKNKIENYLLKPEAKHSKEFFDVGYSQNDNEKLFKDIEKGYDKTKMHGISIGQYGATKYSIDMELGITKRKPFRTTWAKDFSKGTPRLITAHRIKEEKGDL